MNIILFSLMVDYTLSLEDNLKSLPLELQQGQIERGLIGKVFRNIKNPFRIFGLRKFSIFERFIYMLFYTIWYYGTYI